MSHELGLSDKEISQYSIVNALRHLTDMGGINSRKNAEFELFCSEQLAERIGRPAQGIYIPAEVLGRDLTVGTPSAGGNLAGAQKVGFIGLLREYSALNRLGATFVTDLVDDVDIPVQNGEGTVSWIAEGSDADEADPQFSKVSLSPKTVAARADISRRLTLQSSLDVNDYLIAGLAKAFSAELDRVAVEGAAASNEPTGILNTSGIETLALGTDGASLTWGDVVELEKKLAQNKAISDQAGFLTNHHVSSKMRVTEKISSTGQFILGESNTVCGYPLATNAGVPADGTKGTGTNLSSLIFGSWDSLIIGQWGAPVDVVVDKRALINGLVKITAFMEADVGVGQPGAFAAITDIVTS